MQACPNYSTKSWCGCRFSLQPSSSTPDLNHLINWSQPSETWLFKLCAFDWLKQRPASTPLTLVRFSNNTALLLPPEADQGRSEISPLAASDSFTLRRRQNWCIKATQEPVWMGLLKRLIVGISTLKIIIYTTLIQQQFFKRWNVNCD